MCVTIRTFPSIPKAEMIDMPTQISVILAVLISLLMASGCKTTQKVFTSEEQRLLEIEDWVSKGEGKVVYQQVFGTEKENPEKRWVQILPINEGQNYQQVEVYNVYKGSNHEREYYVQELVIDPKDTSSRQPILDYQFVISPDSIYFTSTTPYEFKIVGKQMVSKEGKMYEIYQLFGYAHIGDLTPSHHKYWSPEFGTVLMWFGDDRYFEMIKPEKAAWQSVLEELKGTIKAGIEK